MSVPHVCGDGDEICAQLHLWWVAKTATGESPRTGSREAIAGQPRAPTMPDGRSRPRRDLLQASRPGRAVKPNLGAATACWNGGCGCSCSRPWCCSETARSQVCRQARYATRPCCALRRAAVLRSRACAPAAAYSGGTGAGFPTAHPQYPPSTAARLWRRRILRRQVPYPSSLPSLLCASLRLISV